MGAAYAGENMTRFKDCETAVKDLAERQSVQLPKEGDIDSLQLFRETIPAATRLTLEFEVLKGWLIHVQEILIDFSPNTNYIFVFSSRGQRFEGDNHAPFSVPQKEIEQVTVIIENLSALPQVYSGRIKGFASVR